MKFTLEIKCNNASFGESDYDRGREIARILHELAKGLRHMGCPETMTRVVLDTNGNTVGLVRARK